MSHFSTIRTRMTNAEAIIGALQELGYTVEHHTDGAWLRSTYQGDRFHKANIIVRREQVKSYSEQQLERYSRTFSAELLEAYRSQTVGVDVGLTINPDGTYAWISDDMYGGVTALKEQIQHLYSKHVILNQAKQLGDSATVTEQRDTNGVFSGWQIVVSPKAKQKWTSASTGAASKIRQTY